MTLKNPYFLILLSMLIPYIIWYVKRHRKSQPSMKMPEADRFRTLQGSWRIRLIHLPFLLRCILFTLVILILARPQSRHSISESEVEGIDIMLAVDVSGSMLAQDFEPNRVLALKEVAQRFIDRRPNDNIGLTFFAGEAYTQCPLTSDHATLMNLYSIVDEQFVEQGVLEDGTAIGDGLMNAVLRLRDSKAKSKVIILLTDGVNNVGNISPQTAAEIARQQGVKVYTIGIGTNGMAPMPMGYPYTATVQVPVEIDEPLLRQIATETGGQYFRAHKNSELDAIYNDIDQMERTKFNVRQFSKRSDMYEPLALAALLVLLLELLLNLFVLRRLP